MQLGKACEYDVLLWMLNSSTPISENTTLKKYIFNASSGWLLQKPELICL